MRKMIIMVVAICVGFIASGCGETVNGIGKDARRVGRGFSTVLFRQK